MKENIKASVDSTLLTIELAKSNPLNTKYGNLLNNLGDRLGEVLLSIN